MAQPRLKIMLSSRGDNASTKNEKGEDVSLSHVRSSIKKRLNAEKVAGKAIFDVWINEEEDGDGAGNSWEECINQAEKCDLFISIYNGHAGWQRDGSGIGICHAEFDAASAQAPDRKSVV